LVHGISSGAIFRLAGFSGDKAVLY